MRLISYKSIGPLIPAVREFWLSSTGAPVLVVKVDDGTTVTPCDKMMLISKKIDGVRLVIFIILIKIRKLIKLYLENLLIN